MAIDVKFYIFAKKENSTKRPSTLGVNYSCKLKDNCGVINPTVALQLDTDESPAFNYAYIAEFSRYYFIDEINYDRGLWVISMHVDVLATYRLQIGQSTQYILRAADSDFWDGNVIDNYYPALSEMTITETVTAVDPFEDGCYILGIYGGDGNSVATGPITWYYLSETEMTNFAKWLYSDDMYDLTSGAVDKAIFDPLQYIATAFYLPFDVPYGNPGLPVYFGWYEGPPGTVDYSVEPPVYPPFTAARLTTPVFGPFEYSITVPKHPQASTRGNYLNTQPFTRYTLYAGPFGVIPLDPADLLGISSLTLEITQLDITTGTCRFQVKTGIKTLYNAVEQVAVPMPLAQLAQSILGYGARQSVGAASAAVGEIFGGAAKETVSRVLEKATGIASQILQAVPGIGNAASSLMPQISTSGSVGTKVNFYKPFLSGHFLNIADANDDHAGRPVCAEHQISDLMASETCSGYIKCADGEIAIAATAPELADISAYITGGFFYE